MRAWDLPVARSGTSLFTTHVISCLRASLRVFFPPPVAKSFCSFKKRELVKFGLLLNLRPSNFFLAPRAKPPFVPSLLLTVPPRPVFSSLPMSSLNSGPDPCVSFKSVVRSAIASPLQPPPRGSYWAPPKFCPLFYAFRCGGLHENRWACFLGLGLFSDRAFSLLHLLTWPQFPPNVIRILVFSR